MNRFVRLAGILQRWRSASFTCRQSIFAVVVLSTVILNIGAASARGIQPCTVTGSASFDPFHPLPGTVIRYSINLLALDPVAYAGYSAVVKVAQPTAQRIDLDLIITKDLAPFAGYSALTFAQGMRSVQGTLGPLAVGEYVVATRVRIFDAATGSLVGLCSEGSYDNTLIVYSQAPASAPVIEFYHAGFDHYFMTQDEDEIRDLDTGVHTGWKRTGHAFGAFLPGATASHVGGIARFYGLPSAGLDSHVYVVAVSGEFFNLLWGELSAAWRIERQSAFELQTPDVTTGSCPAGTIPVYRLWNKRADSNHRYTANPLIKAEMISRGWVAGGFWERRRVLLRARTKLTGCQRARHEWLSFVRRAWP